MSSSIAVVKFRQTHPGIPPPPYSSTTTTTRKNTVKCSSENPKTPWKIPSISIKKAAIITVVAVTGGGLCYSTFRNLGGGGGGGDGGGDGGGGGGGGAGEFWRRFFTKKEEEEEEDDDDQNESKSWDVHGFKSDVVVVELSKLSMFKAYKVSDVSVLDDDQIPPLGEFYDKLIKIKAGNVYTKREIHKKLQMLMKSEFFTSVELKVKPNVDGTIGLILSLVESTDDNPTGFSCINIGKLKDVTLNKKKEGYRERMMKSRTCLIPSQVNDEIMELCAQGKGCGARMMRKVWERIEKWYHDEGYTCANVRDIWILTDSNEYVGEIVEGDITSVLIRFKDKYGNVYDGAEKLGLVMGKLPKQLRNGSVFNTKAQVQAIRNINSLGLFSNVEIKPRIDEKYEGGRIVEIDLTEFEQKSPHLTCEGSVISFRGRFPTLERAIFAIDNIHPIFDRVAWLQNLTLHTRVFKNHNFGPAFSRPMYGVKVYADQVLPNQIKLTYGYLLETGSSGETVSEMPECVHKFFAKGEIIKQNGFLNGAIIGNKDVFQIGIEMGARVKKVPGYIFARNDPKAKWNDFALSFGVGAKLGFVRAEYVVDQISGTGALQLKFGDY